MNRRWVFSVREDTVDENEYYLDENGQPESEPEEFIGDSAQAVVEANRRADLWGNLPQRQQ